MAEPQCPTCHEKGMEHRLSMSRGQQLRESPVLCSLYKYAGMLMGYSLKMFFQEHREHLSQFLSLSEVGT